MRTNAIDSVFIVAVVVMVTDFVIIVAAIRWCIERGVLACIAGRQSERPKKAMGGGGVLRDKSARRLLRVRCVRRCIKEEFGFFMGLKRVGILAVW